MKNKLFIAGAIVALLAVSYFLGRCSTKQERDNAVNNILALKDTIHASVITIDGLVNYASEQRALILSQKDALATGELEKETLRKLNMNLVAAKMELTGIVKVVRDSIKLLPNVVVVTMKDTAGLSHDYIKIPFPLLDINEKDLYLVAGMNVNRQPYFSLELPFNGKIVIGWKKSGFLKTTPVGVFATTNQYIKINDINTLIVQDPKKWYDRWYVHALGGAIIFETARQLLLK
jgi:cbb3-type cytochrome oxidase subunit 3